MTACNELSDHEWLTGGEAGVFAVEIAASNQPLLRLVEQVRQRVSPERARLIVELVELRRRATAKFSGAERMFFTRVGLEQATDEWVAAHKALRFAGRGSVADLCSGMGGDLLALGKHASVIGIDRDPIAALYASVNASVVLSPANAERVELQLNDVQRFDVKRVAAWHIDPNRRPAGQRTTSLAWSDPDQSIVEKMLDEAPNAAIKLAPGAKVPDEWAQRFELEWISRGGECRQLVAWHGGLAQAIGKRLATIVADDVRGMKSRTVVGEPNLAAPIVDQPDRFVFDCDAAVLAAHLKGALAREQNLAALSGGPTYLTGPRAIDDLALSCFEVIDVQSLRVQSLSTYLRERGIGKLEIKKRGVDVDPEQLRLSLKLRGEDSATLLLTTIAGRQSAILARRVPAAEFISPGKIDTQTTC